MENSQFSRSGVQSLDAHVNQNVVNSVNEIERDLHGCDLWRATANALWPDMRYYKGRQKNAAQVTGYPATSTARWYRPGCFGVPIPAALRLVAYLEAQIAVMTQLAEAWRQYAKNTDYRKNAWNELHKK